jgi:protein ImuA
MASHLAAQTALSRLRRDIARIEGRLSGENRLVLDAAARLQSSAEPGFKPREKRGLLRLGVAALDAALGGGMPLASLHEIRAARSLDGGVAGGFALALVTYLAAAGGTPSVLWISEADVRRETGSLYAPGLLGLGIDPARLVEVAARTRQEALWAFEAALSCHELGVAVCELRQASLDLSATRRCALRARDAGVTGFLIRIGGYAEPTAAELRLRVSPLPAGTIGGFSAGIGRMAWRLALEKNRGGPTGDFALEWNAHERSFAERKGEISAHPQSLPAAPFDRPAHSARAEVALFRRAS